MVGEIVALTVSGFALLVSIAVAYFASRRSTADYRAKETFKADTAAMLAALATIRYKAALAGTSGGSADFSHEKEFVSKWMSSTTAFAYLAWAGDKSRMAGAKPEKWRTFFLLMAQLTDMKEPHAMGVVATQVSEHLGREASSDLNQIVTYVRDLESGIQGFQESVEHDPILKAFAMIADEEQRSGADAAESADSGEVLHRKLEYLKKVKGIDDPNIDLFLAVTGPRDDPEPVKAALARGADLKITATQLLEQYRDELRDFPE